MKLRSFIILIAIAVLFIWGHSLIPLMSSSAESVSIMKILQKLLDIAHIPITLTEHIVRKLAHFTEHAAAGFILGLYNYPKIYETQEKRLRAELTVFPLIIGFFIGFIDETIQIFSGRGATIQDVWLDFSGIFCGALAAYIIVFLVKRRKKAKPAYKREQKLAGRSK